MVVSGIGKPPIYLRYSLLSIAGRGNDLVKAFAGSRPADHTLKF